MAVSMAKLGSSSCCRPLLQGMMLLALLLLASIQAGPVMAQEQVFEKLVGGVEKAGGAVDEEFVPVSVDLGQVGAVLKKKVLSTGLCKKPDWKRFCSGAKMGIKVHKYLCKAQGRMDKQIPGGASGTQSYDDFRFLAIDKSVSFRVSFPLSYGGNSVVICRLFWSPAAGTPVPSSSYPYP